MKGWWGNITERIVIVPVINHYHGVVNGEMETLHPAVKQHYF
jgi:hypothetical protein